MPMAPRITSGAKLGGIDLGKTLAEANFTDGAGASSGSFKINGTTISWIVPQPFRTY